MNDRTGWLRHLIRPLILAAMLAIIGWSLVQVVQVFIPDWDGSYIAALIIFLVIETNVSHHFIKNRELHAGDILKYRFAEAILLYFVARFLPYLLPSGWGRFAEVQGWLTDPTPILIGAETWIVYIVLLIFWQSIHSTLNDFAKIDGTVRDEVLPYSRTAVHHDNVAFQLEQYENTLAHRSLFNRFLQGGVLLLLTTGLSTVGMRSLADFQRPAVTGVFWTVGFYFICGLLMIGVLRYAALRRKWQVDYVNVDGGVARGWLWYLAILVGLGVVAALILPIGYSMPLLGAVASGVESLFNILAFAGLLIFVVISFPIVWLLWLMTTMVGNESAAPQFSPPAMPPMGSPVTEGGDPLALVRATLMWLALAALLWFTFRTYWQDRDLDVRHPVLATWRTRLTTWWQTLLGWFTRQRQRANQWLAQASFGNRRAPASAPRYRPPTVQNPVIKLYLRFLRRTQAQGIQRQNADTPYEYDDRFSERYPDVAAEVQQLTEAFVEARYSQHPPAPDTLAQSQAAWQRIKAKLQSDEAGN